MYGLWYAARVFFPHPPLIAHVKERKMQNGLLMKTPGCVLVDLAVGGSNPGQCQSVCVHSLCCGSFQITETWCGSLFPPWLAAPPFPASWEDWGWDFSGRGGGDGTNSALLLLLSAATNYQTTNPGLLRTQLCSVGLYVCFVSSMINPENDCCNTNGHFISLKLLHGDKKLWIYI